MKTKPKSEKQLMAEAGWVPANDAAVGLGVELSTIHRRVQGGKLRGQRVGSHLYVAGTELLSSVIGSPLERQVRAVLGNLGVVFPRR